MSNGTGGCRGMTIFFGKRNKHTIGTGGGIRLRSGSWSGGSNILNGLMDAVRFAWRIKPGSMGPFCRSPSVNR